MCEEIEFEIQEEDIPLTMNLEDDVYLVEPKTENLEVTPTKETQYFESETGIYYDNVTVNPIPDEYIIPNLGTKTITKNGTYNATDDNLDGYSQVSVETSGVDINEYFETTYSGTSPNKWVSNNYIKKIPNIIIDDTVTSLDSFCSNFVFCPKIICNSNVTKMNSMYSNNTSPIIDVSGLNTSNVTKMEYMFNGAKPTSIDVSNFDTSKVTTMYAMFASFGKNVEELDLSNFDTINVKSMSTMFQYSSIKKVNLSSFNTSKVYTFSYMFNGCVSLTELDVSNFDTSNCVQTNDMFYNCNSLTSLYVNNFNVSKITDMHEMFYACIKLTSLDLSNWITSKLTDVRNMFYNCRALTRLDIRNFDFTNVTSYNNMFSNVPTNCLIIVKDDTAKEWITSKFTALTNVKTVAELEAA